MLIDNLENYFKKNNNVEFHEHSDCFKLKVSPNLTEEIYYEFVNEKLYFFNSLEDHFNGKISDFNKSYFLNNSTYPAGKTKYNNVFRLIPGKIYLFNYSKLISINNYIYSKNEILESSDFKNILLAKMVIFNKK